MTTGKLNYRAKVKSGRGSDESGLQMTSRERVLTAFEHEESDRVPCWHDAIDLLCMENLYMKMFDEPVLVDSLMTYRRAIGQRHTSSVSDHG